MSKTVENTVKQWCVQKSAKISGFHQKVSKWQNREFRLSFTTKFWKTVDFEQVHFGQ